MVGSLRDALLPLAGQLPSSPPEVHASDGFYTHVINGPAASEDASLAALLGQALTAMTVEHEQDSAVSLPVAANVLRVIGDGAVPVRNLPLLSGVSKEAVAMATGYLGREGLTELARRKAVPRADTTGSRRPGRGAAVAPDGAAPRRMARRFLAPGVFIP